MSGNFYTVLLFSLLLTSGAVLLYFGYRYYIALYGGEKTSNKYITLHNLENGNAIGEIIFFIGVAEKMYAKMEILNLQDEFICLVEEKNYEEGNHRIKFDSSKIPNGEYYYSLTTAHQKTVKKFKVSND